MKQRLKTFRIKFHRRHLEKRKFRFVKWLYDTFPGKYCWADCVIWSFASDRINPFKIESSKGCKIESMEPGSGLCYCGGWENGVCFAKLPKVWQQRIKDARAHQIAASPDMEDLPF